MATYIGVLPADVSHGLTADLGHNASFLRLPHPRTGIASLFLPIRESSNRVLKILEVQAVSPTEARSWFLGDEVVADGKLLVMTQIDPVFLLLPILQATHSSERGYDDHFQPADDIFEDAARRIEVNSRKYDDKSYYVTSGDILQFTSSRCAEVSLQHICDVKEVTSGIIVYRPNDSKILEYLQKKVAHLASEGILDGSKTLIRGLAKDGLLEDGNEQLLEVGRVRAACELLGQYLSVEMRNALFGSYDFRALDVYTRSVRDEALTTSSSEKKPTKRSSTNTTKSSEDKKRKSKASHGVEKLKKANVAGMTKLSSYFTKA